MTPELVSSADPHKEQLLDRYLAGEATEAEGMYVRSWLSRYPAEAAALDAIVHRLAGASPGDVDASLARLRLSFERSASTERSVRGVGQRPWEREGKEQTLRSIAPTGRTVQWGGFKAQPLRRGGWRTLVGIGLGVAMLVAGWELGGAHVMRRMTATASAYTTYATANGERANITLPDGNTVVLSVASRLEVPTNYSAGNHVVRLPMGEAFFTVSHHAGTPFTVITGSTTARVLGTSFIVRHYLTDTTVTVAVSEGKVVVGTAVATARQMVEIDPTGVAHLRAADPSEFSLMTGILTLHSTRLANAIPALNRWYDADIRLGDSTLAGQPVLGKFTAGSLADLADILALTFDVHVVRHGRVLTLFPRAR